MSDIPPEKMDEYYMNHDFLLMKEHNFSTAAAVQFSQLRVQRFNEYEQFHPVIESYLQGKPPGSVAIKFSRIVLTNLLGDEAINHLLSSGSMFPMVVLNILLRQIEYFETNHITIPRLI